MPDASADKGETLDQTGWTRSRTARRVTLTVAAGAGIALIAGGVAVATDNSTSPSPSPTPGAAAPSPGASPDERRGGPGRPFGHRHFHFGGPEKIEGLGFPLHGE